MNKTEVQKIVDKANKLLKEQPKSKSVALKRATEFIEIANQIADYRVKVDKRKSKYNSDKFIVYQELYDSEDVKAAKTAEERKMRIQSNDEYLDVREKYEEYVAESNRLGSLHDAYLKASDVFMDLAKEIR